MGHNQETWMMKHGEKEEDSDQEKVDVDGEKENKEKVDDKKKEEKEQEGSRTFSDVGVLKGEGGHQQSGALPDVW